jgi:hypothetical protein
MIFCAAGDPGGSRALMPVIDELERRGRRCLVLDHGFLGRELRAGLRDRLIPDERAEKALASARAFLFGSSATDGRPLALARKAALLGRPTIHVLDNWSSYRRRLTTDGAEAFIPDLYMVMDEEAHQGAAAEGVPEDRLRITGHPGLNALAGLVHGGRPRPSAETLAGLELPADKTIVAFASEPLRRVLGTDLNSPGHYGFTEDRVLASLAAALRPAADGLYLAILPHPKDNDQELLEMWARIGPGIDGRVLRLPEGYSILSLIHGLAGMASILLYDAWLCGLPVLALQPGCRAESLRRFSRLPGLDYVDDEALIPQAVNGWLQKTKTWHAHPRPELDFHLSAPAAVANLVEQVMERR